MFETGGAGTRIRTPLALPLVTAAAAAATGCGGGSGAAGAHSRTTTTIAGHVASDHGTENVVDAISVRVEMHDYYFAPTVLYGGHDQKLTVEIVNEGKVAHNFSVPARGIDLDLPPGTKAKVVLTLPDSGKLGFYCKNHRRRGMAGAFDVGGTLHVGSGMHVYGY